MQYSMMSSEYISFIYDQNTSPEMKEYPLQYASTDRNLKKNPTFIVHVGYYFYIGLFSFAIMPPVNLMYISLR